jgi:hypothetical protein
MRRKRAIKEKGLARYVMGPTPILHLLPHLASSAISALYFFMDSALVL